MDPNSIAFINVYKDILNCNRAQLDEVANLNAYHFIFINDLRLTIDLRTFKIPLKLTKIISQKIDIQTKVDYKCDYDFDFEPIKLIIDNENDKEIFEKITSIFSDANFETIFKTNKKTTKNNSKHDLQLIHNFILSRLVEIEDDANYEQNIKKAYVDREQDYVIEIIRSYLLEMFNGLNEILADVNNKSSDKEFHIEIRCKTDKHKSIYNDEGIITPLIGIHFRYYKSTIRLFVTAFVLLNFYENYIK